MRNHGGMQRIVKRRKIVETPFAAGQDEAKFDTELLLKQLTEGPGYLSKFY